MIFRTEKEAPHFGIVPQDAEHALFFVIGSVDKEDIFCLSVLPGFFTTVQNKRALALDELARVKRMCHDLLEKGNLPILRALVDTRDLPRLHILRESGWYQDGLWRKFRREPDDTFSEALLFSFTNDHQSWEDEYGILRQSRDQDQTEDGAEVEPRSGRVADAPGPLVIDALASAEPGGPDLWPV